MSEYAREKTEQRIVDCLRRLGPARMRDIRRALYDHLPYSDDAIRSLVRKGEVVRSGTVGREHLYSLSPSYAAGQIRKPGERAAEIRAKLELMVGTIAFAEALPPETEGLIAASIREAENAACGLIIGMVEKRAEQGESPDVMMLAQELRYLFERSLG